MARAVAAGGRSRSGPKAELGAGHNLPFQLSRLHAPHIGGGRMPAWAWLAIVGFCIAAALPVVQSSNVAETGSVLVQLEAERERLKSDVRQLSAHVGELTSLSRVKREASTRLNMVEATPTIVLEVNSAAPPVVLPSRYLPRIDAPLRSEPSRLQELLDIFIIR